MLARAITDLTSLTRSRRSNWRLDRLTETESGVSPIARCQACRSSCRRLHGEQAELAMMPQLSAIGMNSAGGMLPRRGWSHRISASKPAMVRSSSRTMG
jgi:hypothetical protein